MRSEKSTADAKKTNWVKLLGIALAAALLVLSLFVLLTPPPEDDLYTDQTYFSRSRRKL